MKRIAALIYGVISYFAFFGTILYMIGFTGNLAVPKSVDTGMPVDTVPSVLMNIFLIVLFGAQHSVMARPGFKKWWTRYVPEPVERSTYVLISSLLLMLMFWQWRPLTSVVWDVASPLGQGILYGIFAMGWGMVFLSSFLIDHFDLFGLRQVYFYLAGKQYTHVPFKLVFLYKFVRNPLMLGFLLALWSAPVMTAGHLLFSGLMTAYIFTGIYFEEQTILSFLGAQYRDYHKRTPMILPLPKLNRSGKCPLHF